MIHYRYILIILFHMHNNNYYDSLEYTLINADTLLYYIKDMYTAGYN